MGGDRVFGEYTVFKVYGWTGVGSVWGGVACRVEPGRPDASCPHIFPRATHRLMDDLKLTSKAAANTSIFTGEDEAFAWSRLVSRLNEMQSEQYWERAAQRRRAASRG